MENIAKKAWGDFEENWKVWGHFDEENWWKRRN